jgi:hypothetical protein
LIDPYNGQPMRLKATPDGWVVYSVGTNGRDDGGSNVGAPLDPDVGLGPVKRAPSASQATPDGR